MCTLLVLSAPASSRARTTKTAFTNERGDTHITGNAAPLQKDLLPVRSVPAYFSSLFLFLFAGNQVLLSCHHRIHHTAACASDAVTRCLTVVTSVLLQPRADRRTMALSRGGRKGLHERSRSPDPDSPRSPTRAHYSTPLRPCTLQSFSYSSLEITKTDGQGRDPSPSSSRPRRCQDELSLIFFILHFSLLRR